MKLPPFTLTAQAWIRQAGNGCINAGNTAGLPQHFAINQQIPTGRGRLRPTINASSTLPLQAQLAHTMDVLHSLAGQPAVRLYLTMLPVSSGV